MPASTPPAPHSEVTTMTSARGTRRMTAPTANTMPTARPMTQAMKSSSSPNRRQDPVADGKSHGADGDDHAGPPPEDGDDGEGDGGDDADYDTEHADEEALVEERGDELRPCNEAEDQAHDRQEHQEEAPTKEQYGRAEREDEQGGEDVHRCTSLSGRGPASSPRPPRRTVYRA